MPVAPVAIAGHEAQASATQGQAGYPGSPLQCWGIEIEAEGVIYPGRPRRGRGDDCGHGLYTEGKPVIGPSGTVLVLVATRPVDFRKGIGTRSHEGRSVFGCCLWVPSEARGPDQAELLGRYEFAPVRQTA